MEQTRSYRIVLVCTNTSIIRLKSQYIGLCLDKKFRNLYYWYKLV
jgi:hypothetical protein